MITQTRLRELLRYDPMTGLFTRKVARGNCKKGTVAGGVDPSTGYFRIHIDGRRYSAHRLVFLYVYGTFPPDQVDHKNHVRDDNRMVNLRLADNGVNGRNMSMTRTNTSGFTGVGWSNKDGRWTAQIRVNSRQMHLGNFRNKKDAIAARKAAEVEYGYHPNHGSARTC